MRRLPGVILGALTLLGLAGCQDGLHGSSLSTAFAPTFGRTLIRQEQLVGQPGQTLAGINAHASCLRGGDVATGAGDDWMCTVLWTAADATGRVAVYDVQVKTNGCYEADGPQNAIGGPELTDRRGELVTNPLYSFDGCFAVR